MRHRCTCLDKIFMDDTPDEKTVRAEPQEWTEFLPTVVRSSAPPEPSPPSSEDDEGQALPKGSRLGEFEIVRVIGLGGFGIVYEAWDHSLERTIALKEFMPSNLASRDHTTVRLRSERHRATFTAGLRSFVNEARSLASFDHPALVKVYRFWEANGTAYMAMPLYKGPTVKKWLSEPANTVDEHWVMSVLAPLTEALALVHEATLVHRDISPDNIILVEPSGKPLLLDFGAARKVISDMSNALTVILKPSYAPVEQYGEIPGLTQGPWTDVYALAATIHYAITGKTPPNSVGRIHNETYVPLATAYEGRYSERLLRAIDHGLAVLPKDRIPSMSAFRQELGLDRPSAAAAAPAPAMGDAESKVAGSQAAAEPSSNVTQTLTLERRAEPDAVTQATVVQPRAEQATAGPPSAFAFPRAGDRLLERFRIGDLVISDGAHQAFRALDEQRNVEVVLQVLSPRLFQGEGAAAALERLAWRCSAYAGVSHPALTSSAELLTWNEARLIVCDFRGGRSLRTIAQEAKRQSQPLALEAVGQLATALGEGLQALHAKALHGALSPDSLILGTDGRWRMLGIGLGGVFSQEALGAAEGFPASEPYQAPELTQGDSSQLDGRADQFALAAIVFELLAGSPGAQPGESLHARNAAVPLAVSQAVGRAMSANRDARFERISAFLEAWSAAAMASVAPAGATNAASGSRLGPAGESSPKPARSRMPLLMGVAALALVFAGVTWIYLPQVMDRRDAQQQVQAAQTSLKELGQASDRLRQRYEAEKNAALEALETLKQPPEGESSNDRQERQRSLLLNERALARANAMLNRLQSELTPQLVALGTDLSPMLSQALGQEKLDDARAKSKELSKSVAGLRASMVQFEEARAKDDAKRTQAFIDEFSRLKAESLVQFDDAPHKAAMARAQELIGAERYDEAVAQLSPVLDALMAERRRHIGAMRANAISQLETDPDAAMKLLGPIGRLEVLLP
jgi:serine/threonine protein kinase